MNNTLRIALLQAMEIDLASLPSEQELHSQISFSARFEREMKQLISKTNRKYIQIFGHRVRRAAAVAAAILILSSSVMSVEAAREKIIEVISIVYEEFTQLIFKSNEADAPLMQPVYPTAIPNGFSLVEDDSDEYALYAVYSNSEQDEIVYQQSGVSTNVIHYDTENADVQQKTVLEQTINIIIKNNATTVYWFNDDYHYQITAFNSDLQEILKMAESIIEQN